jgi:TRAP-type C4-dicarboxylate transport system permease small subunit
MNLLRRVESALTVLSAVIVCLMMLLVVTQIIARTLRTALPGIIESLELLVVAVAFLGLAYTQSINGHIRIDVISNQLPVKWRQALEGLLLALALGTFGIMTHVSGEQAYEAWVLGDYRSGLIHYPLWPSKMLIPIGAGLLSLRLLIQLIALFPRPSK